MLGQTLSTFPISRLETVVDIRRRTSEGETPNRGASDMGGMERNGRDFLEENRSRFVRFT
jgi:hypothetical protein